MNRVIHFQLPVDDPQRAIAFYQRAFGWAVVPADGPMEYWLIFTGNPQEPGIDGGMMRRQGPGDTLTTNTLSVADMDAVLAAVTAAGGTVLFPKDKMAGVGWMSAVRDTEGNTIGLMQPFGLPPLVKGAMPPLPSGAPRPVHFEMPFDNAERAVAFYRAAFGWELTRWEGDMDYWLVMTGGDGDGEAGINGGVSPRRGPQDGTVNTLAVADLDATVARVVAFGGSIMEARIPVPGVGWMAYCFDTEGTLFGLMQEDTTAGT